MSFVARGGEFGVETPCPYAPVDVTAQHHVVAVPLGSLRHNEGRDLWKNGTVCEEVAVEGPDGDGGGGGGDKHREDSTNTHGDDRSVGGNTEPTTHGETMQVPDHRHTVTATTRPPLATMPCADETARQVTESV
eukprot:CAMPEP_0175884042 /NCGR_PEP_ID=MMETSP0107_2-20121207/44310_1 /TAXON_ID=195067 ORGANISM="Goniomonas pacifica, Strain CCMP1869" /NCGR_SAMPLE_ID=MMETSP0107_2 /ASSEMBLY_ACC=CAM_ASM_000203 /LENGTH=133 /DNA_ID=CAMNT_0017204167 /DNA_START=426 /DNA_END=827 /DNA_ORIENTATION=-